MDLTSISVPGARDGCGDSADAPPRVADPCTMVIFGPTGDLAKRKLLPALYNLRGEGLLGEPFAVVGVGRAAFTTEAYRQKIEDDLREFGPKPLDAARASWLSRQASYLVGGLDEEATYRRLREYLAERATGNILFYLATPPGLFGGMVARLGSVGLGDESAGAWRRVIIEKPFGRDLESARALNQRILNVLREPQVYRIDHYLGKETVQNIMALRFGNGIFEPIWNRRYVDHVQITVAETVGVEERGSYYDTSGALRDMVQNHLFQLLAVTAMEPPISFQAEPVRDERLKVLHAIHPFTPATTQRDVMRGQYDAGLINGHTVPAYRAEPKVAHDSRTESYVAMKVMVDNWRWAEVPFYLRTGKRLPSRVTEIAIQFKRAPLALFQETPVECMQPNWLVLRIQPREGIALQFEAKVPGPHLQLGTVKMDFCYADYFGHAPHTGYETLLYDCMTGDATLFHRADIVEAGWAAVAPMLTAWQEDPSPLPAYEAGSWGPAGADALLQQDGRAWHDPLA